MLKNTELRLGNLIIEDGIQTEFNGDFYHYDSDIMKPIPLTEEWLIKFGFYSEKQIWRYEISNYDWIDIQIFYDEGWFILDNENGHFNRSGIKYVHQLQNLYFALTGVELEWSSNAY